MNTRNSLIVGALVFSFAILLYTIPPQSVQKILAAVASPELGEDEVQNEDQPSEALSEKSFREWPTPKEGEVVYLYLYIGIWDKPNTSVATTYIIARDILTGEVVALRRPSNEPHVTNVLAIVTLDKYGHRHIEYKYNPEYEEIIKMLGKPFPY